MNPMRLIIAIILDALGFVCAAISWLGVAGGVPVLVFIGEMLSFVPDFLGFIFLNPAMGFSSRKNLKASIKKRAQRRFIITFILELLPFGALPVWTINELLAK